MAIYDNRHWLLSHIRNSFISTDDTGMCEIVMLGEDLPKLLHMKCVAERGRMELSTPSKTTEDSSDDEYTREQVMEFDCYPEMDQSDDGVDPLTESYELQHDMEFGMHRQRSNTAQKLEKMEAAQRKASKIKVIKWENPSVNVAEQEREQMLNKKDIETVIKPINRAGKSMLSDQLEKCPLLPQSKFIEFAKYDGTAQFGLPTKTYKIFMTMLPEELRNYPITICVVASAKILDLIGFTCYKYSIQHPECVLGPVSQYALFICEDDGEVDWDFPPIDNREACSKFAFSCLGLVDLKLNATMKAGEIHTSSIPDKGGLITMPEEKTNELSIGRSRSATFDSKDKIRNRQDSLSNHSKNAVSKTGALTKTDRPNQGGFVKFGSDVMSRNEDKFRSLTFSDMPGTSKAEPSTSKQSSSSPQDAEALNRMKVHEKVIEAPMYQSYRVRMVNRLATNPPVMLGISGQRIEIDPLNTYNLFWQRIRPVSYNMDSVVWCDLNESKSNRSTFRVIYSQCHMAYPEPSPSIGLSRHHNLQVPTHSFKHHDFECDSVTAKEIVEKINRILELQSSTCHKEYKAARERKSLIRRSFHLPRAS